MLGFLLLADTFFNDRCYAGLGILIIHEPIQTTL